MTNPTIPIIDFHVHCFPDALAPRAVGSVKDRTDNGMDGTLDSQKRWMARQKISYSVILNMASRPDAMDNVNRFALSCAAPGLIPFGSVHPDAANAIETVEELHHLGIRGIKFHTAHQRFQFDNDAYRPLYRRIGALGLITLVHCGVSSRSPDYQVYPVHVARVIDCFQGAPFVAAHMGGITPTHPEFKLLTELPVYVDTALMERRITPAGLNEAVNILGVQRVLFGSDLPWGNFAGALNLVRQAGLPWEKEHMILCKNAEQLLGLAQQGL